MEGTPLLRLFLPRPGFTRYLMQRSRSTKAGGTGRALPSTIDNHFLYSVLIGGWEMGSMIILESPKL